MVAVGIFVITFDRNKIETWDFHRSTADRVGHAGMVIFIGQYTDQSGELLLDIIKTRFWRSVSYVTLTCNTTIR